MNHPRGGLYPLIQLKQIERGGAWGKQSRVANGELGLSGNTLRILPRNSPGKTLQKPS